jgi:hypothetical protein
MKIGLVITMYDEFDVVKQSLINIKKSINEFKIIVIHSDNGLDNEELNFIKNNITYYELVPDLSKTIDKFELPSASVCRNYSMGFTKLYEIDSYDLIIGITADTLINDIDDLISSLENEYYGHVLQAIGQSFHSETDNPKMGITCGRYQHENITDIMPQLFIFNGTFAKDCNLFSNIENKNKYTSEQNLGDNILKCVSEFKKHIKRLHTNNDVYNFNLGVKLQVKGLGHTRNYL